MLAIVGDVFAVPYHGRRHGVMAPPDLTLALDSLRWPRMAPFGLGWPRLAPFFFFLRRVDSSPPFFYVFGFLPERGMRETGGRGPTGAYVLERFKGC